jgi:ferric-dicitrate binding protein FerR (iron transport regulator)
MTDEPALRRYQQETTPSDAEVDRVARRVALAVRPAPARAWPRWFAVGALCAAGAALAVWMPSPITPRDGEPAAIAAARSPELAEVTTTAGSQVVSAAEVAVPLEGAPSTAGDAARGVQSSLGPQASAAPLLAPQPPDPARAPPEAPAAPTTRRALHAPNAPQAFDGGQGVALQLHGAARQDGHRFELDRGSLDVEVPANRGLAVSVTTREAQVEVVGTGFTVDRSAEGTLTRVRHGAVRVTCVGGQPTVLREGQSALCGPVSAAGLLARARERRAAGAGIDRLLVDLDAGLARTLPRDPVGVELRLLRAEILFNAGRLDEARADVDRLRAEGVGARGDSLLRLEAALAERSGRCADALALLNRVSSPLPSDDALRAACR